MTIEQAEAALEEQKARKPRLAPPKKGGRINWTNVSMAYQPRLTSTWFETMSISAQERNVDRVFGNSYFWVITRTTECFY